MYAYEIKRINADPQGAAEILEIPCAPPISITSCFGKNGAKCAAQQIGPIPGPPPPCGIAKVLCKFK